MKDTLINHNEGKTQHFQFCTYLCYMKIKELENMKKKTKKNENVIKQSIIQKRNLEYLIEIDNKKIKTNEYHTAHNSNKFDMNQFSSDKSNPSVNNLMFIWYNYINSIYQSQANSNFQLSDSYQAQIKFKSNDDYNI